MAGDEQQAGDTAPQRSFAVRRPIITTIILYFVIVVPICLVALAGGVPLVPLVVLALVMVPFMAFLGNRFLVHPGDPGRVALLIERATQVGGDYPFPYTQAPGRSVSSDPSEGTHRPIPPRDDDDDILRR